MTKLAARDRPDEFQIVSERHGWPVQRLHGVATVVLRWVRVLSPDQRQRPSPKSARASRGWAPAYSHLTPKAFSGVGAWAAASSLPASCAGSGVCEASGAALHFRRASAATS